MSGTDVAPRTTTDPGIRWPVVWEHAFKPWYSDCAERRPASAAAMQAALHELETTLAEQPDTFWPGYSAVQELHEKYRIGLTSAFRALCTCPGSILLPDGVWCAVSAAAEWDSFKQRVYTSVPADALATLDEIVADIGASPTSIVAALGALERAGLTVWIRNEPSEACYFVRARPGRDMADYSDLYRLRTLSAA